MNKNFLSSALLCLLTLLILGALAGCSRDPNVRKQKYLQSGKKYVAKAKYREASIEFLNALHLDPKFPEAHYELAECDLQLGLLREAYVELQRTVILQPNNFRARLELGQLLLATRQYTKAAEQADRVLAKDPNNVDAHILRAAVDTAAKQVDAAVSELNTAAELDPQRSGTFSSLATLETLRPSQSAEAEANFKKAVELDPKSVAARMNLAAYYDANKRFSDGEQTLKDALTIAPKDPGAYTALIRHDLAQGNKVEAENTAKLAKQSLSPDSGGLQFLALYYLSINDAQSAIAEYKSIANTYPKDIAIQHAYLNLAMMLNRPDEAWPQIGKILKGSPRDQQALIAKGILLLAEKKPEEARGPLEQVVKSDAGNVVAQYQLGVALNMLGQSGEAEGHWEQAARVQPKYLPAQKALAAVAFSKGDAVLLRSIGSMLVDKAPMSPDGYQILAQADILQDNPRDAETHLQKATSVDPASISAYIDLGRLYILEKRSADAEKVLNQVLSAAPDQIDALAALSQLSIAKKESQKAEARLRDTVNRFPNNVDAHLLLASVAGSQNDLDEAENELTKAVLLERSPRVYSMLAGVQNQRGETAKLHATLEAAVGSNPNDADAYWMLGTIYDKENDTLNAESNYRKALALRPDFALAANNLAFLLVQNAGNIDEAITFAELAHRKLPGNSTVADTLGWAYYQKGMSGLAIEVLRDAVNVSPENPSFHYHLGMAYAKNGSREHAREELDKALQLESDDARKDEIRKGLSDLG